MKLSELSIERPVLATVMSLAIVLFGVLSFTFLPVREYPDIESPIVSVTTFYRGANPQVVETEITDILEEQLSTLEGVKLLTSSSAEQVSSITIEFNLGRDVDKAANDVRDRVSRVRGELPSTAEDPTVAKQDVNAQPILWLALYGERYNTLDLSEFARNELAEKLQRLEGVGAVIVGGERRYAMRIWLDSQRLAAYGLTVSDVSQALRTGNAEIPSGRVEGKGREFAVRTKGDLERPEQFASIVLASDGDRTVKLGDVARIELGSEDDRSAARFNTLPAVGLGIVKQQKASTVDVAKATRAAIPGLREILPAGMQLDVAYDSATFIEESIHEVVVSLGIAVFLVFVVIFIFLGSIRATLIPALAIPVSVIGTFTVTYALGYSINILTLLALVLAIGLVVDDAIVMLENIHRHMEMGKPRMRASIEGSKEIGFAIIATTITLVAVFVPVAFLQGQVGRLFSEFGVAVAVSVLISGFVALTLTPMLCSRFLGAHGGTAGEGQTEGATAPHKGFRASFDHGFDRLTSAYDRTLRFSIARRGLVLAVTGVLVVAIGVLFRFLPSETVPTEDRGWIFNVIRAPEGATLEYTDRYVRVVEDMYQKLPAKDRMFTAVGLFGPVTDGFMFVGLKPKAQRASARLSTAGSSA